MQPKPLLINRVAGVGTSRPHETEYNCTDQYHTELGRGETEVEALRAALKTLPAETHVHVAGCAALRSGAAGELLERLP
jgi:hypothetical protein